MKSMSTKGWAAWPALAGMFAASLLLPVITQPQDYHHFSGMHPFAGVDDIANVLSNAPFVWAAFLGLLALLERPVWERSVAAWALIVGLVLTTAGSSYYHAHPTDTTLWWDRLPIGLVFASVLALSLREFRHLPDVFWPLAIYGLGSVAWWGWTGNLTPYLVLQFGGLIWMAVGAWYFKESRFPFRAVLAWYVVAKVFELLDPQIGMLTHDLVGGHPIKHYAAAMAVLAICRSWSERKRLIDIVRQVCWAPRPQRGA